MLNLNEHQLYRLNQAHRQDLMREIEQLRLAQVVHIASQPAHQAALVWLGSALVSLGKRMQAAAEHEPPVHQQGYR